MKKFFCVFFALFLSLTLIACSSGDDTMVSGDNSSSVNSLTTDKIVGFWTDSDIGLTYEFRDDYTFVTYSSGTGGVVGEYKIDGEIIELIFSEDSTGTGRFNLDANTFEIDDTAGVFKLEADDSGESSSSIVDTREDLGPFFGKWYSKDDGVVYTLYDDGTFVLNKYDGSIINGIFDHGERDIYLYGDDDTTFTGYVSEDESRLEISAYNGVFTRDFFDVNSYKPQANYDIASIFGDWKYPDNSTYYTFNSDMTFVCYYAYERSYNGQLYFDGSEITYTADNGNQGSIEYFPEIDEILFSGTMTNLVRGTVEFVEDTNKPIVESIFVGRWEEASDIGDGYLIVNDDGTFELSTAELGTVSGSCHTELYVLYLDMGGEQYEASYDAIEASVNVSDVGRFFKRYN